MGRGRAGIAVGVALVVVASACDSGGSHARPTLRASLQMRPVEVTLPPGGAGTPGQTVLDSVQPGNIRYVVGAPALTERDVRGARALDQPGIGWGVNLALTKRGTRKLNRLAEDLYPKTAPQNSVAIVVDGNVQSAPAFMEPRYRGSEVQVFVPGMTARRAKAMATSLRP